MRRLVVGVESSSSSASPAADATPLTPPVSADASVVAARANKVARLRAACRAQLGAAFEPVHAFLKSAERRRLGDAEARARLLDIARGDETKLAACFAVDMLCFEERSLEFSLSRNASASNTDDEASDSDTSESDSDSDSSDSEFNEFGTIRRRRGRAPRGGT